MKKGLITLAVILALVMSMAIMAPAFAADANDADYVIVSPKAKDVGIGWGGQGSSTACVFEQLNWAGSPTVDEDGSALFTGAGVAGAYIYTYPTGVDGKYNNLTSEFYPYMCVSVKITGIEGKEMFYFVYGEGSTEDMPITSDLDEYTKIIGELPAGIGMAYEAIPGTDVITNLATRRIIKVADYANGGHLQGVKVNIEYIGFFKTEADAQAFDYAEWLEDNKDLIKEEWGGTPWEDLENSGSESETSTPETSEPETSEPETSVPETSAPETSAPETSAPETSEPETSTPETSAPETSEPETSEPETSEPETSEPESQTSKPQTSTPDKTDDDEKGGNALTYILIAAAVVVVVVVVVVVAKKGKK